jgi:hypothetical protein
VREKKVKASIEEDIEGESIHKIKREGQIK